MPREDASTFDAWGAIVDLLIFAGTRPEIIKLSPVLEAARASGLSVGWVATGQHGSLADDTYKAVGMDPSLRFDLAWDQRSLTSLVSALTQEAGFALEALRPKCVLVQGDTATAYSGAMAAFLNRVPVGHVEAGLRTDSLASPFPEEGFRRVIARLSARHFTPTRLATRNLVREGVAREEIVETGNTVVDAVLAIAERTRRPDRLEALPDNAPMVLVTAHRRENWDGRMNDICAALIALRDRHAKAHLVFPVHTNPRVAERVQAELSGQDRIHLLPALPYDQFIWLLQRSQLILTDSGGVQEEGTTLGKPILIMRDSTERTEAIEAGAARLVGSDATRIVAAASSILKNPVRRWMMTRKRNPFGDGQASQRIVSALTDLIG